jgi:hypothetical protein
MSSRSSGSGPRHDPPDRHPAPYLRPFPLRLTGARSRKRPEVTRTPERSIVTTTPDLAQVSAQPRFYGRGSSIWESTRLAVAMGRAEYEQVDRPNGSDAHIVVDLLAPSGARTCATIDSREGLPLVRKFLVAARRNRRSANCESPRSVILSQVRTTEWPPPMSSRSSGSGPRHDPPDRHPAPYLRPFPLRLTGARSRKRPEVTRTPERSIVTTTDPRASGHRPPSSSEPAGSAAS